VDLRRLSAPGLAGLLAAAGAAHFLRPATFDPIVPSALPGPARWWTWGSGVAELAVGAAVAVPATRRAGAAAAAALFVAVYPANVQMTVDAFAGRGRYASRAGRVGTVVRLPMQVPLVLWALAVRRSADPGSAATRAAVPPRGRSSAQT